MSKSVLVQFRIWLKVHVEIGRNQKSIFRFAFSPRFFGAIENNDLYMGRAPFFGHVPYAQFCAVIYHVALVFP
ncbi:hypothetical protein K8352_19700, partial [Flavobacteriaceae bacterium F89]